MRKIGIIFALLASSNAAFSQFCTISVSPQDTLVCIGSEVTIQTVSNLVNNNQAFNFNSNSIPAGWSTSGGSAFAQPCGTNPTATPYYWASTSVGTPQIQTAAYDVSCGGSLIFDMVFSVQSGPSPCEGPDEYNEGVILQYSTNNGATWIDIIYYCPNGQTFPSIAAAFGSGNVGAGQLTNFTSWGTYTVPMPVGALTTNTMFRWQQPNSSSSLNDNWGLDNIILNATGAPCGATTVINWSNGLMDSDDITLTVTQDTVLIAYVFDTLGNQFCQSGPITISVIPDNMTYSLPDTLISYCPTTNPSAGVTNLLNANPPVTYDWGVLGTTNPVNLQTGGAQHDTFPYPVTITDACGYTRIDTVVLVVNQTLGVDTIYIGNSACVPDGYVSVLPEGVFTTPAQQVIYHWTGPGVNSPNFINASVWTDLSPGWYYITITDARCTTNDSAYVDIIDPPVAQLSSSVDQSCVPSLATFTNSSQNASSYQWDFGGGNIQTTTDLSGFTETYYTNGSVQLIAYEGLCSDTAYANVTVISCGCTNQIALNYDSTAVQDDGSCILPEIESLVPNILTANGDGVNDLFYITVGNYKSIELTIVNRWGDLVFNQSADAPNNVTWNGKTSAGTVLEDGVYFFRYKIEGITPGSSKEGQGFVTLSH